MIDHNVQSEFTQATTALSDQLYLDAIQTQLIKDGLPVQTTLPPVSLETDENRILTCDLGTVHAMSRGDGFWSRGVKQPLTLTLEAWVEPGIFDRNDDGEIEYVSAGVFGWFNTAEWDVRRLGLPYTDTGIEDAVNEHLAGLGCSLRVAWSEQGAQGTDWCDFDCDWRWWGPMIGL